MWCCSEHHFRHGHLPAFILFCPAGSPLKIVGLFQ